MKKIFIFFLLFIFMPHTFSETIQGGIEKRGTKVSSKLIDSKTKEPIPFALIKIPTLDFETKTDENGLFKLNANISGPMIMSVEKSGYKPFSITIDKDAASKPFIVSIEKSEFAYLSLEADVIHLGDNKFSINSANSKEFKIRSSGPYFTKTFKINTLNHNENAYFTIGSIIGLDTLFARKMGQSHVSSAYSSPAEIYFNGHKLAEVKFNGDGQQVLLPKQLIKQNGNNEITLKTGRNLFQNSHIDYDDIEVANLHIEFKPILANED